MSRKTIDKMLKDKLPKEYILNISTTKENTSINISSPANAKEKFDAGITINGDLASGAKALELISEIVSESV